MNAEKKIIKTVVAGLGRAGWDIHMKALKDNGHFKITAVIEPVAERRQGACRELGCAAFASYDDFFSKPAGELVVIATPSGGHGPESVACLERGLHVVVDKPMCQGIAEADAMIALAAKKKRVLTCYQPYRFNTAFIKMQEIIRSGRIGRIVEIKCNRSTFTRRNDWVMKKARGGGLHNVWGSHTIDQCLQLAASPIKEVFADLQCTVTPGDADDHCKIIVRCANGTLVDAEVSNCMIFPPQPEWMVAGTQGGMITCEEGIKLKYFNPEKAPALKLMEGPAAARRYGNEDVLPWQEELVLCPGRRHLADFYDNVFEAVCYGKPLFITPESVRPTIEVLESCRRQNPQIWAGFE